MKTLREAVGDYLALRRGLGFKLKKHERFLEEFATFLEQEGTSQITSRLALLWATQPQHIQPAEWAARLGVVRGFARYWSATDATTEVPPDGLLPYRPGRAKPYLYSDEQIHLLLKTAKNMRATHSLQPWTYHCLLGLLAVTGLRISEALNLQCADIDWSEGVLTIRNAKFRKSRLVPLHASSLKVLSDYAVRRNHLFASRNSGYFFPSRRGARQMKGRFDAPSIHCRGRLAFGVSWPAEGPACTIFAIALQSRRCCTGIAMEKTSNDTYPSCPRISVTHMSLTPTGT